MPTEPKYIDTQFAPIRNAMISTWESSTGRKLYGAQPEALEIDMFADREQLLRIAFQEASLLNLVDFSKAPMIDFLGKLLGVVRLPSQPAKATLRFWAVQSRTADVIIIKGTKVLTKDSKFTFTTDSDLLLPIGTYYADVKSTCTEEGPQANGYQPAIVDSMGNITQAGEINILATVIPNVEAVHNMTVSSGGSKEEDTEHLRTRILEAPESFTTAGSFGAYRFHALSVSSDIIDATVLTPEPLAIHVYILAIYGEPSPELIADVATKLSADKVRPISDKVTVKAAVRRSSSIEVDLTLFKDASEEIVKSDLQQKLTIYQTTMKSKLGKDLIVNQIRGIIGDLPGIYDFNLKNPISNPDPQTQSFEWWDIGPIIINITGRANE
jgi:phage-related baseplate assembly protein